MIVFEDDLDSGFFKDAKGNICLVINGNELVLVCKACGKRLKCSSVSSVGVYIDSCENCRKKSYDYGCGDGYNNGYDDGYRDGCEDEYYDEK